MLDLSMADLRQIADAVTSSAEQRSGNAKSAFVSADATDKATLENYVTMTAHYPVEFEIFTNFDTAWRWVLN